MSDAIEINRGDHLRAEVNWTNDADGTPIDITGRTLEVLEAYPRALLSGTVTVLDGPTGKSELYIGEEAMAAAGAGRVNWIRLAMRLPSGDVDASPRIAIEVL